MSNVVINGVEYAPVSQSEDIRIVILQRGWVFVGNFHKASDSECVLTNAKNYRLQRSGQGFGYVAKHGPTKDCKLDPCELPVRFHPLTIVATIDCEAGVWKKNL